MTVYLDTSTVLRVLLRQPKPLAIWARWERAYASELLHVEACRVIDRLRLEGALDDQGVADAREQLGRIDLRTTSRKPEPLAGIEDLEPVDAEHPLRGGPLLSDRATSTEYS